MDKAGQPYLLHPLRLMRRVETETEKILAVLHEVVEDSQPPRWGSTNCGARAFPSPCWRRWKG